MPVSETQFKSLKSTFIKNLTNVWDKLPEGELVLFGDWETDEACCPVQHCRNNGLGSSTVATDHKLDWLNWDEEMELMVQVQRLIGSFTGEYDRQATFDIKDKRSWVSRGTATKKQLTHAFEAGIEKVKALELKVYEIDDSGVTLALNEEEEQNG